MKNKLLVIALCLFMPTGCAVNLAIQPNKIETEKAAYTVEHGVLIELQIKTIDEYAIEGYFLRAIALRGHDMSSMGATHEHEAKSKDQPVNLLNELVKHGCIFKAQLHKENQRWLIKKDTALFDCHDKSYDVDGELVDTHGVRGGALSLKKTNHIYFKVK